MTAPIDVHGRPLRTLRLSVTDRCNLRCAYCMPEESYTWLPRGDLLSFEELVALTDVFLGLGVERLRLTGGEPLLRQDLPLLVQMLAARPGLRELALTSNGVLLEALARPLREAGLQRVTVSLDTLRRDRFQALTRRDALDQVLAGIAAARAAFGRLKLDTVVMRGVNEDELTDLLDFAREAQAELRFIEYMDVGGATRWSPERVVPRAEILTRLAERAGPATPIGRDDPAAPAERFRLPDGTVFGVIASTTQPFCGACDRARLTGDGQLYRCLYGKDGVDLRGPLRGGEPPAALAERIRAAWSARTDRGAEERLRLQGRRRPLALAEELRQAPHLEMHTRGG